MQLLRLCVIYLLHNKRNALNSSYTLASSAGIFTVFASTFALDISAAEETSCDAADNFECSEEGSQPPESKNVKENPRLDKPIWWDYSIDDLFEKYFNCAEILYGYGKNKSPHKKQVPESQDDYDDEMDDDYDYDDDDEIFDDSDNEGDEDEDTTTADTKGTSEWWEKHRRTVRHEFVTMRDKYRKEVNLIPVKDGEFNSVMTVPAEIGDAFEKGRGVFATEPIPKGTLVTNLDNDHVGIFKEGHSWRKFAVSLPREMACDFIEWR